MSEKQFLSEITFWKKASYLFYANDLHGQKLQFIAFSLKSVLVEQNIFYAVITVTMQMILVLTTEEINEFSNYYSQHLSCGFIFNDFLVELY